LQGHVQAFGHKEGVELVGGVKFTYSTTVGGFNDYMEKWYAVTFNNKCFTVQ